MIETQPPPAANLEEAVKTIEAALASLAEGHFQLATSLLKQALREIKPTK